MSYMQTWECLKIKIREFSQRYCKNKAVERKQKKNFLEQKFEALHKEIDVNDDENLHKDYICVKKELEHIYQKECKGAAVRARVRWFEEGEKCTKYFLGLEKYNLGKKEINQLYSENNDRICVEHTEILQEVVKFYSTLYKRVDIDIKESNEYINSQQIPCFLIIQMVIQNVHCKN